MKLNLQQKRICSARLLGFWWFPLALAALLSPQAVVAGPVGAVTNQDSGGSPAISSALPNPSQPHSFVFERHLRDGTVCQITVRGHSTTTNQLETVDNLEISLGGQKIIVPPEACSGLNDLDPASGIPVGNLGKIDKVLLTGGKATARWRATLNLQNGRVIAREYAFDNQTPATTLYPVLTPAIAIPIKGSSASANANPIRSPLQDPIKSSGQ